MEGDFKIIDYQLYKYVSDEVNRRHPCVKIESSALGKGGRSREERYLECHPFTGQSVCIKLYRGYFSISSDKLLDVPATMEFFEKNGQYRYRSKQQIQSSADNAVVLDAFLELIKWLYEKYTDNKTVKKDEGSSDEQVTLSEMTLDKLFEKPLSIPDYQRIYCWEKEQVETLLKDIENIITSKYFMGNIILHHNGNNYDIVDGQQRLVTLSILYNYFNRNTPLLSSKFLSIEAQQHVYDNAQIIKKYINDSNKEIIIKNSSKLSFGVLIIDQEHLDLAFTFFTNTNSRGKLLTDYDLLKPHHLRYIPSDYQLQQQFFASKWDQMINANKKLADDPNKRRDAQYIHVLELLLFRLRKWSRKRYSSEIDRFVYDEYKTAQFIEEIPPFGENFDFFEPIQGGQHFFEYVEHFIIKYKEFTSFHETYMNTAKVETAPNVYDVLCQYFTGYSDQWYRHVMEALVFCYFLKFGNSFISEAALSIVRYISQIRFEKAKAYEPTIVEFARNSEIVLMIEQATSPTFFLAEIESKNSQLPEIVVENIRAAFRDKCKKVCDCLSKTSNLVSFNNYFKTRYERITSK